MSKTITKTLKKSANLFPVVGVGASAGGLAAFKTLIGAIPVDSGMAWVLVQHLSPAHVSILPELLQRVTKIPVLEITDDIKVEPDHIYIIPSNKLLMSNDGVLELSPRPLPKKNKLNMPIDLFFKSLAEVHQSFSIGIVLSGTGNDGSIGLKAIKEQGGITGVQDLDSAEYDDMPRNASQEGMADFILPPDQIPAKLLEITKQNGSKSTKPKTLVQKEEGVFRQILSLLRTNKGTDFTYYKQATIQRRIRRRMEIHKIEKISAYFTYLKSQMSELDELYKDLLIPVTSFFRDAKSFENLCTSVFPKILDHNKQNATIRIWVAGCSTGQEPYSIAMCLMEYMETIEKTDIKLQIFATDISEASISKARMGFYDTNEIEGLAENRLQEFFTKTNGGFLINKEIRNRCVFAMHNFLTDPPFGKMDLISCRNVLIYMEPYLQKKAFTSFHFALNPKGMLMLGKSETANSVPYLFTLMDKKEKLFSRKEGKGTFESLVGPKKERNLARLNVQSEPKNGLSDYQHSADEIILNKYAPVGVVVNETMEIVHFRGNTALYLEQQPGKPSHNLLKMAKSGLAFELRSIIHKSKRENKTAIKEYISINIEGKQQGLSIESIPLPNLADPHYLILFHKNPPSEAEALTPAQKKNSDKANKNNQDKYVDQLEEELSQNREDMRGITEEQEAINEELQSANEELQSNNEEMQSLNEELETSKEELHSTNEELTVLNHELVELNDQVTETRDYAEAIVETIREPLLVLDNRLRVKTANSAYYKFFRTNEEETEGKFIFELGDKQWNIPRLRTLIEEILTEKGKLNDFEVTHDFPKIGQLSLLLNAREINSKNNSEKLILLAIEDISEKKAAKEKLIASERRYHEMIYSSSSQMALFEGDDMILTTANDAILESWGKGKDLLGKSVFQFLPEIIESGLDKLILKVYRTGNSESEYEFPIYMLRDGKRQLVYYNLMYQPHRDIEGNIIGVVVIASEVTPQAEYNKKIRESESNFRELAELMPDKISTASPKGRVFYFNKNWLDYSGLSFEELKDLGWQGLLLTDELIVFNARLRHSFRTGNDLEMEMQCRNKNGEYIWHLTRASPVKNETGKITMWITATTEIQKLKEEEKRKEDFLKMVSHELKTPITSIKGYVQLLLNMLGDKAVALETLPLKPSLERIDNQVARLTRLISEMLDVSRIEDNRLGLQMETFSINELVDNTVNDINHTISEHHIKVSHEFECYVNADKDRLGQVLINFITNAIKYSPENKKVIVKVYKTRENLVTVSVKDKGIGIDKKHHENLFKRFYRVGGKSEETYSGFGIGLYLAKEIMTRHNGVINVESEKGKGSVFSFTLSIA